MEAVATQAGKSEISRRTGVLVLLAIVVLVALPIRLYLATAATMVSRDGVIFIWYAQGLAEHPLAEMREQAQHPLYPAMLLAGHGVVWGVASLLGAGGFLGDPVVSWLVAGVGVTLLAGLAVVVSVYVLTAVLFDRRIGLVAAALAATAAEFCQLSADALTDMPHLALYLFGVAAGVHGMRHRRLAWLFVAGLLSGTAYLVRPEGAEVAVAALPVLLFGVRDWPVRRRLAAVAVLVLGAGLPASPYMLATGKLVQKKSIGRLIGGDEAAALRAVRPARLTQSSRDLAPSRGIHAARLPGCASRDRDPSRDREGAVTSCGSLMPADLRKQVTVPVFAAFASAEAGRALLRIGEYYGRALRVTFLLPAVAWLVCRRRAPANAIGGRLVAAAMVLHVVILVALIVRFDYLRLFSLRHVQVMAGLTLPFSAAGIEIALRAAGRRRGLAGLLLAVGLIGPTLPWMLETPQGERAYLRRAADWIRTQDLGHPPRVLTTRHRVAFYAGGVYIRSPLEADAPWILAEAREYRADWLVFDERGMLRRRESFFDDLRGAVKPDERLDLAHTESQPYRQTTNRALIYRYHRPP